MWKKLTSRKFALASAGMAAGFGSDNPVLAIVIGAVYIIAEGIIDAFRRGEKPDVKALAADAGADALGKVGEIVKGQIGITNE